MVTPALCLIINAVSYLLSAVLLLTIRHVEKKLPRPASWEKTIPFRLAWQEGWAVFLQNRVLLFSSLFPCWR